MCGIAGIFHYNGRNGVSDEALTRMRDAIFHRGPDGGRNWVSGNRRVGLAHRRLSIIDLSEAASQPMRNEDGTVWLTYNGEIWNHIGLRAELKQRGHTFATDHCDTEVIVHGYEQWGLQGLLQRLDGDFAFAIWDEKKKVMSIARDRVGVKPVYFTDTGGVLLFASEIKSLLCHPAVTRDIDPLAMYHYLSFLTTPAPMTMFKGIYKLPAGYALQIDARGKLTADRYWDAVPGQAIDPKELKGRSRGQVEQFYIDGIRDRLTSAVEKRMMTDVPFGVFLSGGIDSSTNVALMSRYTDHPLNTFSVGFKDHTHLNELDYAQRVAQEFDTNHHVVTIDEQDMFGYLEDLVHSQDEPIADWVCIPLYFVSKLTHDSGVTVVQVGEGSDEQFSGYASYMAYLQLYHRYWKPFRSLLPKFAQRSAAGMARAIASLRPRYEIYADIVDRAARDREHFWSGATVFWDIMKRQLVTAELANTTGDYADAVQCGLMPASYLEQDSYRVIESFLAPFDDAHPGRDALTRMIYNEFKLRLPELLLMRVDKISMSTSLEARVPFLDHELVEFTMDIPEPWKTRNGEAKYLLKKAVEGLIPHDIIYRKKMGFGAPMTQWLRGEFGKYVEAQLFKSSLMRRGYFEHDYIRRLIADHRSERRDNSLYIWTLFNLTAWYDYWIDSDSHFQAVA
ncbi:MAG: asparagine synthase (glutamine-hydrolyzing) [Gammaproteobacteria bacterium]